MFKGKEKDMPVLGREAILQADDIVTEPVDVPEWGGTVLVKGMTGKQRDVFEKSMLTEAGKSRKINLENIRAKLCAATVVDKDGKELFTPDDVKALSEKSASALQRVYDVGARLCGLSNDDVEELAEGLEDSPFEGLLSDQQVI